MATNHGNQNFKINEDHGVATISIMGDIGESFFSEGYTMQNAKRDLENIKAPKINLIVSSLGGNLNDALTIHDLIKMKNAEVTSRILGATASSGTVVAQAADKGKAEISKNAMFLVHPVMDVAIGNAQELRRVADENEKFDKALVSLYSDRIGGNKTKDEIKAKMDVGEWITPQDAKDFGFVDKIFTPGSESSLMDSFDSDKINACGLLPDINKVDPPSNNGETDTSKLATMFTNLKTDLMTQFEALKAKFNISQPAENGSPSNDAETQTLINGLETKINEVVTANEQALSKFNTLKADYDKMFEDYSKLSIKHRAKTQIESIDAKIEADENALNDNEKSWEENAEALRTD